MGPGDPHLSGCPGKFGQPNKYIRIPKSLSSIVLEIPDDFPGAVDPLRLKTADPVGKRLKTQDGI